MKTILELMQEKGIGADRWGADPLRVFDLLKRLAAASDEGWLNETSYQQEALVAIGLAEMVSGGDDAIKLTPAGRSFLADGGKAEVPLVAVVADHANQSLASDLASVLGEHGYRTWTFADLNPRKQRQTEIQRVMYRTTLRAAVFLLPQSPVRPGEYLGRYDDLYWAFDYAQNGLPTSEVVIGAEPIALTNLNFEEILTWLQQSVER